MLDSSTSDKFSCHVHTHLRARESMQDGGAEVVREAALFADTMQGEPMRTPAGWTD